MKNEKILVYITLAILVIFFITNTSWKQEAAIQREALLSSIATPFQIANARIAFFIFIPALAAYLFFTWSRPSLRLKDLWNNLGVKMGLIAGFLSIFVIGTQIALYIITIALMGTWGAFLIKKRKADLITAILIPFVPAYYFTFINIMSTTTISLITFFNAATVAIFIWIIPIMGSILTYAMYRRYIPLIETTGFGG
jgi:hypothetical protein